MSRVIYRTHTYGRMVLCGVLRMYTAIEPPLDLIKCVTTEDTRHDGLDHPPEP